MYKNNSSEIIVERIDLDETLKKLDEILRCLENPNFSLKYWKTSTSIEDPV